MELNLLELDNLNLLLELVINLNLVMDNLLHKIVWVIWVLGARRPELSEAPISEAPINTSEAPISTSEASINTSEAPANTSESLMCTK